MYLPETNTSKFVNNSIYSSRNLLVSNAVLVRLNSVNVSLYKLMVLMIKMTVTMTMKLNLQGGPKYPIFFTLTVLRC